MTSDRLTRAREGRIGGGVCAGLGRYTGIDPLVFRVGFALLVFASWCALPLYVAALLLMPDEDGGPAPLERATGRLLAGTTTLTLLGVLLGTGILLDLTGQGLLNSLGGDALAALVIAALIALAAQARGADLVAAARTLPDRLRGEPLPAMKTRTPPPTTPLEELQAGWIDLATLQPYRPPAAPRKESAERRAPAEPSGSAAFLDLSEQTSGPASGEVSEPERPAAKPEHSRGGTPPVLSGVTLLLASAAGASSLAFTSGLPETASLQVAFATALAVVALGLVVGTWAGRTNGLVAVGALLSVALIGSTAAADVQNGARFGEVSWRPVDPNAAQPYRIIAGQGVLDLTALPLRDGGRYRVAAEVGLGGLRVVLPAHAQVELHVSTGLGDVTVDKKITSGPRARVERTLPGAGSNPPVLELHVKGRLGDLEVVRGGA
ncbi:PspC domain-containing protein [Actinocorallia sp. B10E7]|uniref:PspC domain-containing protein n=1 Tax=Actinocorallia sp. B10E7 TaxID=3153558 RepID=UPI00325EF86E